VIKKGKEQKVQGYGIGHVCVFKTGGVTTNKKGCADTRPSDKEKENVPVLTPNKNEKLGSIPIASVFRGYALDLRNLCIDDGRSHICRPFRADNNPNLMIYPNVLHRKETAGRGPSSKGRLMHVVGKNKRPVAAGPQSENRTTHPVTERRTFCHN